MSSPELIDAKAIIAAIRESNEQHMQLIKSNDQRMALFQSAIQGVEKQVSELVVVGRYSQKEMSEHKSVTASKFKELEQHTSNSIQAVKADNNDAINAFKHESSTTLARIEVKLDNHDKKNDEIDKSLHEIEKKISEITPTTNRMKMIGDNLAVTLAKWLVIGAMCSAIFVLWMKK